MEFLSAQKPVPAMDSIKPSVSEETAWSSKAFQFRAGDGAAPLFLFPGHLGDLDELSGLVRSLRVGRPIVGLRLDCLTKDGAGVTVAKMASDAVSTIQGIQPIGPFHLAGYSFGGLVAFAAAQLLKEGGYDVGLLALIGTPISQRYWPLPILLRSISKRTMRDLFIIARLPVKPAIQLLIFRAARFSRQLGKLLFPTSLLPWKNQRPRPVAEVAMELFRPGFYPGVLTFLEGINDPEHDSRPWLGHAAVLRVQTFPTDHLGLVLDSNVQQAMAQHLDALLTSLQAVGAP